jgi:hypothetical protein
MNTHYQTTLAALRLLLLAALLAPVAPALAQRALLSFSEQPAKLIRKTTVYDAPAGARLQTGDIIESGTRGLQLEWPGDALVALGPSSTVQLGDTGGAPTVNLLRGWLKVAADKRAARPLTARAGTLDIRVGGAGASGLLHLTPDQIELFVEHGTMSATDKDKAGAAVPIDREQYAERRAGLALRVTARPPQRFIAEMPRTFFDPLVAIAGRAKPAELKPLREAGARDLAEWTNLAPIVSKQLVAQFSARLADPVFAKDAETLLADNPDWRQALQQAGNAKRRLNTISNSLF